MTSWIFMSLLISAITFSIRSSNGISMDGQNSAANADRGWSQINGVGFPVWMVLDRSVAEVQGTRRELYVFMEDGYFSRENLCETFRKLASSVPQTERLDITLFSDKAMIKRAANPERRLGLIDFPENAKGRRSERQIAEMYLPAEKGYLRAYYHRSSDGEWFKYTKDLQSEKYIWIDVRGTPKEDVPMTLIESVRFGDVQTAGTLVAQGVGRDVRKRTGFGLIRHQPLRNKAATIRLLIDVGEDINERDEYGGTAIMRAAASGDSELAAILLDDGADANARAGNGETALVIAARLEYPDVVSLLAERGIDVNQSGVERVTALMYATFYGDVSGIRSLTSKGADPDARDTMGRTAVFYVNATCGNVEAVAQALVKAGANMNLKDKNGETALMRAADSFHAEAQDQLLVLQALLRNGADVRLRNSGGKSALDIATMEWGKDSAITQVLQSASIGK